MDVSWVSADIFPIDVLLKGVGEVNRHLLKLSGYHVFKKIFLKNMFGVSKTLLPLTLKVEGGHVFTPVFLCVCLSVSTIPQKVVYRFGQNLVNRLCVCDEEELIRCW